MVPGRGPAISARSATVVARFVASGAPSGGRTLSRQPLAVVLALAVTPCGSRPVLQRETPGLGDRHAGCASEPRDRQLTGGDQPSDVHLGDAPRARQLVHAHMRKGGDVVVLVLRYLERSSVILHALYGPSVSARLRFSLSILLTRSGGTPRRMLGVGQASTARTMLLTWSSCSVEAAATAKLQGDAENQQP